MKVSKT